MYNIGSMIYKNPDTGDYVSVNWGLQDYYGFSNDGVGYKGPVVNCGYQDCSENIAVWTLLIDFPGPFTIVC